MRRSQRSDAPPGQEHRSQRERERDRDEGRETELVKGEEVVYFDKIGGIHEATVAAVDHTDVTKSYVIKWKQPERKGERTAERGQLMRKAEWEAELKEKREQERKERRSQQERERQAERQRQSAGTAWVGWLFSELKIQVGVHRKTLAKLNFSPKETEKGEMFPEVVNLTRIG